MNRILLSFLFSVFYFATYAEGQADLKQIKAWVIMLSVRDDPNFKNMIRVAEEIMKLDSSGRCDAYYRIEKSAHEKTEITLIRARLLQLRLNLMELNCTEFPPVLQPRKSKPLHQKLGFEFSGVDVPKEINGLYGLRYAEFVVPLVKAVQELNLQKSLHKKILFYSTAA